MSQVLRGPESRCAIEIMRTEASVVMAILDSDCQINLISHPLAWAEVGEQFRNGKHFFEFDQVWKPLMRQGPTGIEPYPLFEAVRKFIRGTFSEPSGFKGGSLDALADALPHGDIHVWTREWGFIGRFSAVEDATMIAAALKAVKPIIFGTPEEFMALADLDQAVVLTDLDPTRDWPATITKQTATGVFEMAKAKKKEKVKKVQKAEAAQRRADGPVAQARVIFESMRSETDSSKIIAACEAKGINRGTATTQLGRWRKEQGIVVKRGGARKKTEAAAPKKDDKKKGGKGKKGKKKAGDKDDAAPPGIPASEKKGEKRHKPTPPKQQPSSPSPSTASPSNGSQPKANQEASGPKAFAATASSPTPGATTAAGSTAATSAGTASGTPGTSDKKTQ